MALDPLSLNQSSVFGRFYNLVAVTILFASEGHQLILRGFLQSFRTMPLNLTFDLETFSRLLLKGVGEMFLAALQIAGPLIAVLFLTDVAFGLLNRVAPALNAFQLGFPAKIFLLIMLSGLAITLLPQAIASLVDKAVTRRRAAQRGVRWPARRPNNRPNSGSRRPSEKARSVAARTSARGSACSPPASCCRARWARRSITPAS